VVTRIKSRNAVIVRRHPGDHRGNIASVSRLATLTFLHRLSRQPVNGRFSA
jgi:hypothetical protein